jgi:hypothetical protein
MSERRIIPQCVGHRAAARMLKIAEVWAAAAVAAA